MGPDNQLANHHAKERKVNDHAVMSGVAR
jgi:hypothetical protein